MVLQRTMWRCIRCVSLFHLSFLIGVACKVHSSGWEHVDDERPPHHPWDAFSIDADPSGLEAELSEQGRRLTESAWSNLVKYFHPKNPSDVQAETYDWGDGALLEQLPSHGGDTVELLDQCGGTKGSWCTDFKEAQSHPFPEVQRGSKACPGNCNGVGVCDADTGLCLCPAGWSGDDCKQVFKRPCTNRLANQNAHIKDPIRMDFVASHINDTTGEDLNWTAGGWAASRCGGVCDDNVALCYCGEGSKHRRIPGPPGSVKPIQRGRPMSVPCQPSEDKHGNKLSWGSIKYEVLYGEAGWCNRDHHDPERLSCPPLPVAAVFLNKTNEPFCLLQCSGHGECDAGFCHCYDGWYGVDCSRKRHGLAMEPSDFYTTRQWLRTSTSLARAALGPRPEESTQTTVEGPVTGTQNDPKPAGTTDNGPDHAGDPGPVSRDRKPAGTTANGPNHAAGNRPDHVSEQGTVSRDQRKAGTKGQMAHRMRKRPFIYVYELPVEFNTRLLQYRNDDWTCVWRGYDHTHPVFLGNAYSIEIYLHEMFLMSHHRTYDPMEADFFFVPTYVCCLIYPILGYADRPRYYAPLMIRPMHAANFIKEAKDWIQKTHPWWNMTQGRYHIWVMAHDEGACYMPSDAYKNSIVLTHWGRTGLYHESGSAFSLDNYTKPVIAPGYQDTDWRKVYMDDPHPCYDPSKDLVLPKFRPPYDFTQSPILGHGPYKRDILLYFRGDVGLTRKPYYSRGIRQELYRLAHEGGWREKYGIVIGTGSHYPGDYSNHLARSKFCLVAPGDGYSSRAEDGILHGCLPLIVMDGVHAVFESILDYGKFSIRVAERDLPRVPEILGAISDEQVKEMQRQLSKVWHRFLYATGPLHRFTLPQIYQTSSAKWSDTQREHYHGSTHHFKPRTKYPVKDDAFHTIIQWLHGRMKAEPEAAHP